MTTAVHGETDLQSNATDQMLPGEYNAEMMYYAMAEGKLPTLLIAFIRIAVQNWNGICKYKLPKQLQEKCGHGVTV